MPHSFGSWPLKVLLSAVVAVCVTIAPVSAEDGGPSNLPKGAPAPPSPDGPKYDLRYKLAMGEVLRYEVTHSASIQSTIEQSTQAAQTKTDSIKGWKVTDVLPNGEIEFMNVVERLAMVNQLPDHDPVEYDSARDQTPPPGFEDAAKAVGVPLSVIRITPQGKVIRRDPKLRQLNFDDDAPIVVRLPDQPVPVGGTWDEPFDIKVELQGGSTKQVQTRRHFKLADVAGDIAKIEVTYQILTPLQPPQEAQLVERMMNGVVEFNMATGRVVRQQMEIDKRILGFAGAASSMQYVMKMEEKLLNPPKKLAAEPPAPAPAPARVSKAPNDGKATPGPSAPTTPTTTNSPASAPRKPTPTAQRPSRPPRTSSRPKPAPNGARYVR